MTESAGGTTHEEVGSAVQEVVSEKKSKEISHIPTEEQCLESKRVREEKANNRSPELDALDTISIEEGFTQKRQQGKQEDGEPRESEADAFESKVESREAIDDANGARDTNIDSLDDLEEKASSNDNEQKNNIDKDPTPCNNTEQKGHKVSDSTQGKARKVGLKRIQTKRDRRRSSLVLGMKHVQKATIINAVYSGDMKDEMPHGPGRLDWSDGSWFEGDFLNGLREGEGQYVCDGGNHTYKGQWRQSKMHGRGVETWPNGDTYIGEYRFGKFHGSGILSTRRGRYEGLYENGLKCGFGRMEWRHGDTFEGVWKNNVMHGEGRYVKASDGSIYIGEWLMGMRNGKGAQTDQNGEKYDGEWKDNKRHGIGIQRYANGRWRKGEFLDGVKKRWLTEERI